MARDYAIYDVFTEQKLAGNPLAVVFDGDGLTDAAMQSIAAEFNLSETVFVQPAAHPLHTAKLRIFTPARELPFAGHPTVGAAIALAERVHDVSDGGQADLVSVLEENIGPVRCAVKLRAGEAGFSEFTLPRNSVQHIYQLDRQAIADALSLQSSQIGFENHVPTVWSAGVPFLLVPVHDMSAAGVADFVPALWERMAPLCEGHLVSAYIYCRGGVNHGANFHARMFSADMGLSEDPATGSAVAALSGAVQLFDGLPDGHHALLIEQGVEMGRPSHIHLHLDVEGDKISKARIGGRAVRLAKGSLEI